MLCVTCAGREKRTGSLEPRSKGEPNYIDKEPSEYEGVVYCMKNANWQAVAEVNGVEKVLGSGSSPMTAAQRVRQKYAELKRDGIEFDREYGSLIKDDAQSEDPSLESSEDDPSGGKKKQSRPKRRGSSDYNSVQKKQSKNGIRWRAGFFIDGKWHGCGTFDTEIEAARAVNEKCDELGIPRKNPDVPDSNPKKETSKYNGVYWIEENQKWKGSIYHEKRQIYCGIHSSEKAAAHAVNEKCKELGVPLKNPSLDYVPSKTSSSAPPPKKRRKLTPPSREPSPKGKVRSKRNRRVGDNQPEYAVEKITDHKIENGKKHYFVRWKGYSREHDSWEPLGNVEGCEQLEKYLKDVEGSETSITPRQSSKRKRGEETTSRKRIKKRCDIMPGVLWKKPSAIERAKRDVIEVESDSEEGNLKPGDSVEMEICGFCKSEERSLTRSKTDSKLELCFECHRCEKTYGRLLPMSERERKSPKSALQSKRAPVITLAGGGKQKNQMSKKKILKINGRKNRNVYFWHVTYEDGIEAWCKHDDVAQHPLVLEYQEANTINHPRNRIQLNQQLEKKDRELMQQKNELTKMRADMEKLKSDLSSAQISGEQKKEALTKAKDSLKAKQDELNQTLECQEKLQDSLIEAEKKYKGEAAKTGEEMKAKDQLLKSKEDEVVSVMKELKEKAEQVEALQKKTEENQQKVESMGKEVESLRKEVKQKEDEIKKCREMLEDVVPQDSDIDSLQKEHKVLAERTASEHKEEIERLRDESEKRYGERMEEIDKLKVEMTDQLAAKDLDIDSLQNEHKAAMELAASEHEKEIERLRNDSERRHAERMEEIEKLKSDMTEQLSAKELPLADSPSKELHEMHKEVNAKKAEAERLLKRIQEMKNLHMQEKRELNDQLVTERRKLATLNQPLRSTKRSESSPELVQLVKKLRTQLSNQTARVKTLEKEKEKAADNIDGIYGSDTRVNIMKLRQERDSYKAKLENSKNKTNEETYKLKVQLKKIQDDLKKTQDELQNSKTENNSLRKSLEEKPRKVGEQVGADLLAQKESEWKKREAELLKQLYKKDATSELQQDLDVRFKKVETTTSDLEKNLSKFENDNIKVQKDNCEIKVQNTELKDRVAKLEEIVNSFIDKQAESQ